MEVKAEGTPRGADEMMLIEAKGSYWLKLLGGISLLIGSFAGFLLALHRLGWIG